MKKYLQRYILICFYAFFVTGYSYSQNKSLSIQHYKISDGLSQSFTTDICRDKTGYIWIGTQDGLNRFDGYDFTVFRQDPADKQSLSDNFIIDLCPAEDSTVWIVNNNGLEYYDCKTNKFYEILKNKQSKNSTYSTNIKAVAADKNGTVWIRTYNSIIEYDRNNNEFFEYRITKNNSDITGGVFDIFRLADDSENLWTGSAGGLVKFNKKQKKFTVFKYNPLPDANNEIYAVFCENKNKIWAGSKDKLYLFDTKNNKFTEYKTKTNFTQIQSIYVDESHIIRIGGLTGLYCNNGTGDFQKINLEDYIYDEIKIGNISNIFKDPSGLIWLSTDFGIFKINTKKTNFELYRKDKNNNLNFSSNTISAVYHDVKNDIIWLGTRGYGLNLFYRKTGKVKQFYKHNSGLTDNNIFCIVKSPDGNIWTGTAEGPVIYSVKQKKFIPFNKFTGKNFDRFFAGTRLSDILFDGNIIWFATYKGLLKYENNKITEFTKKDFGNGIADNETFKIIKSSSGNYWIATLYGLSKYNPETGIFTNYTKENGKISNNIVPTVFESSDSIIWVGTGTGLNKYNPESDSFKYYTSQSHGFSNDFIYTILEDKYKNLWMSTNRGIIKFNPKTEEVTNFSTEDNLQGYEFNINAAYIDENNELFWGGVKGLNSLKMNKIKKNTYAPKPVITHFYKHTKKGKKEVLLGTRKTVKLTYNQNSFDIHFAVPEYTFPAKNSFKYRIKESNAEWTYLGHNNFINFFQLAPGTYTFQILGANSDNVWNPEPTVIKIIISSPWWLTTGAYIIYILIFSSIIGGGFLLYNREIRKENRILHEKQTVAREVEKQKELLAVKNNNIAESMRYASGIINALLPTKDQIRKIIPDSFVLFMSKEIVSGDFYWIEETEDKIFIAAVDCTGHGVPGAFMSIIGLDLLRNITESGINTPSKILDHLNRGIYAMFRNEDQGHKLKDGMDISLIALHKMENIVEFAGAMNQMFLIRDDKITEIKGDRFSVSPANYLTYGTFTNHLINVEEGDAIYLFSDGYVDQFGGPDEKKFKYRRFRHLLLNNYEKPMREQKNILKRVINTWKGNLEQVDDILVIGLRIHTD
ncbi:MAG: SpoIIE family protein phosphatase [Chlorobi bacterium]|nr:SpoIIE family protein phosphatase [Chlorobiota bacterium]